MELTVLGKYGPYGKAGGGCSSGYLVKNGDDFIVLDMGCGTLSRLMSQVDVTKIKHIYISHLHYDHTSDLLVFRYLLEELNHTVNIYTHHEDSEWYNILFDHPNFNVVNIDEDTVINIGSMELGFLPMKHTVTDYAIIIRGDKTLCYTRLLPFGRGCSRVRHPHGDGDGYRCRREHEPCLQNARLRQKHRQQLVGLCRAELRSLRRA